VKGFLREMQSGLRTATTLAMAAAPLLGAATTL
jgi:hypothetical protein